MKPADRLLSRLFPPRTIRARRVSPNDHKQLQESWFPAHGKTARTEVCGGKMLGQPGGRTRISDNCSTASEGALETSDRRWNCRSTLKRFFALRPCSGYGSHPRSYSKAIWKRRWAYKPGHILCHGARRTAIAGARNDEMVRYQLSLRSSGI